MEDKIKRTINEVLDIETGECINSNDFFKKDIAELTSLRSELDKAIRGIREPLFTCYYCKQKIRIRGGNTRGTNRREDIFHFAHLNDSDDCHIKTNNVYTKDEVDRIKYNGAKESILHQKIKGNIAEFLNRNIEVKKEVSKIEVEKIIRNQVSKSWKKPDINAYFLDKRMAIELQLSTTWLSVITQRQEFYKNEGIYIFWVFHNFDENDYQRKLTINDVVYTNNQNAYVFDEETYDLSKKENDLILKCYFKTYFRNEMELGEYWENEFIKLSDLTFDDKTFKVFFRDTEQQKRVICQEIDDYMKLPEVIKIKRKQDEAELEQNIEKLNHDIKEIGASLQKVNLRKYELQDEIECIENTTIDIEKIITYFSFSENKKIPKPFKNNDGLIKELKEKFGNKLKEITEILFKERKVECDLIKSIFGISRLNPIIISDKTYYSLDPSTDWEFIEKNYKQVEIIKKENIEYSHIKKVIFSIEKEHELKHYRYNRTTLILMDLSAKIKENESRNLALQEVINQLEFSIAMVKEEIRSEETKKFIEEYSKEKVISLKKSFEKKEMEELNLNSDLVNKRQELNWIVNQ
jgi:competence CoiA-like predicted nuclease